MPSDLYWVRGYGGRLWHLMSGKPIPDDQVIIGQHYSKALCGAVPNRWRPEVSAHQSTRPKPCCERCQAATPPQDSRAAVRAPREETEDQE